MKIREANLDDADEVKTIINLINQVFCEFNLADSKESFAKKMRLQYGSGYNYKNTLALLKESPLFFVAEEGDHIVGMIRGTDEKVLNLYILKERQMKGIGKKLLKKYEDTAKKNGSHSLRIKSSRYALNFYLHHGYTIDHATIITKHLA